MKLLRLVVSLLTLVTFSHTAIAKLNLPYKAHSFNSSSLDLARDLTVRQYIDDLARADAVHIASLFETKGMVISTSQGQVDAKAFFSGFLSEIESATTELHQIFIQYDTNTRWVARFHFNFKLIDGEIGDGEYMDEFVFAENSEKLKAVYMFENLKFNDIL